MTSIAYETVELGDRSLPLLSPMSEIAGRLAAQVGANCLLQSAGVVVCCLVVVRVCVVVG